MRCKKATFSLFVLSCLLFNCFVGVFAAKSVSQDEYEACKKAKCSKGSADYEQCKKSCGYNGQ